MTVKIFRRGSARCIGLLSAFVTILLCLYYISIGQPSSVSQKDIHNIRNSRDSKIIGASSKYNHHPQYQQQHQHEKLSLNGVDESNNNNNMIINDRDKGHDSNGILESDSEKIRMSPGNWNENQCYPLTVRETNITSMDEYAKFDFQPEWIRTKEYWDKTFEERFEKQRKDPNQLPLKIFIVPHSHNDPGWLKTFVGYFQSDSRQILNFVINKMKEYKDMTFIWSEMSFLQLWWSQAHPTKQRALKHLVQSGRFEITTGGWVMTDEANAHVFAMIDQLIEGHHWLKINLNVTPTVGWSIDPFGHGSTVPYLLAASDFEGTIIQRIHYAWKQWFAKQQMGDFLWMPYWKTLEETKQSSRGQKPKTGSLLTHNMPFDIYSIKHSCGPHPFICLNFDFRKIPGEYTEYSIKAQFITDENVAEKAELLIEQYSRTASLFPHNVALIPVGDDFRYNKEKEIEQQYTNYKKLIDHINEHKDVYKAEISFGTPKDYFNEIRKRSKDNFPTFKGDFFVYSDIFSEGRPAYWSGYFTTRPFYKLLSTELEHNLRSTEILFTVAYNMARQRKNHKALKVFEKNYEKMILARRNLGLFQHHDAITGTSKSMVMRDYGIRLFESIQDVMKMQESTIELIIQNDTFNHNFILNELERDSFYKLPRKTPITLNDKQESSFIVYNSLAQERVEIISLRTNFPNVAIVDENNQRLPIQINPVWNVTDAYENGELAVDETQQFSTDRIKISIKQYEILFVAKLPPLSLITYKVINDTTNLHKERMATIYCNECNKANTNSNNINNVNNPTNSVPTLTEFNVKNKQPGDIQLENYRMRLLFDEKTGFLKTITRKSNGGKSIQCSIKFAAYKSAQFHSGAYLFKTDPEQHDAEKDVLEQYDEGRIIITSGPIFSDVTVIYGPFLAHTVRIFNTHTYLDRAMYIENDIDYEPPPKNRETELFMRFLTEIENGSPELPEFYTDQNGFQYHKRIKVPSIGIEGNYYPITSAAFIQDDSLRLTIITNHAQGAASFEPGQLEVMLDRRTLYDDYRGMGEGIVDSRLTRHKFWILLENIQTSQEQQSGGLNDGNGEKIPPSSLYQVPTILSNQLANSLRYPPNMYFIDNLDDRAPENLKKSVKLFKNQFPCDVHLFNVRTLTDEQLPLFPSRSALVILHRQGYDCTIGEDLAHCNELMKTSTLSDTLFEHIKIENIDRTSLTGLAKKETVKNFSNIKLEPMEIQTFNVTFAI